MTTEQIMREIDAATQSPMSQEDALAFLESLADDIDARIDGLKSDLGQ